MRRAGLRLARAFRPDPLTCPLALLKTAYFPAIGVTGLRHVPDPTFVELRREAYLAGAWVPSIIGLNRSPDRLDASEDDRRAIAAWLAL